MSLNHVLDTLSSERFLSEPPLDVVQDIGVNGVILVKNVFELEVRSTETVAEVLCEDPAAICMMVLNIDGYGRHGTHIHA
jgi:hypothetical protein